MFTKSRNYYPFLVALILSTSCFSPAEKYKEDTIAFNAYLQRHQFDKNPTGDSVDFVLLSSSACHGCVQKSFNKLLAEKKVVLIAGTRTIQQNHGIISQNTNYLEDETDELDRLTYHKRNIGIVRRHKRKVFDIVYVDPSTIDSVIKQFYGI